MKTRLTTLQPSSAPILRASGYARVAVAKDALLHADRGQEARPGVWIYTRPDILAYKSLAAGREPANAYHLGYDGPPDLVVEILSESTWKKDVGVGREIADKMRHYQSIGVSEYWIYNSLTMRFGSGRIRPPISSRTWRAGLDKPLYVNTANRGAAPGMAADACLCAIDLRGPRGIGRAGAGPATGHSGSASADGGGAGGRRPVAARPADGFQGMPTPSWPHGRPGNASLGRLAGTIEEPVPSGPRD